MTIPGDNPIRRPEDDALGRVDVARAFTQQVLALDASEGVVVGVLGPWGSGKTSLINLARPDLEEASLAVVDFNPWMFSGAEQLLESFFIEVTAQLRITPGLSDAAEALEDYGERFSGLGWLPLVGPWVERVRGVTKLLSRLLQRRKEGVADLRTRVQTAMTALDRPIVIVLDDIDRLSTTEIRDMFKLVRLTASFPNIVYVMAFDRARVEAALAEQRIPGRDYLEKILQVALDLPAVPGEVLSRQVLEAIDAALTDIENRGPFDEQVWPDVFMEIVRPLIRNMRDVRRYVASVHGTIPALDGQVALADALALEAVRVFLPDVFARIHSAVEGLTTTSGISFGGPGEPPHLKTQIEDLIGTAEDRGAIVRAAIERLFPAAQRHIGGSHYGNDWRARWLRERRVAHEAILRFYLERVAGEDLTAFTHAEHAWTLMADRDALDAYLRSLDPDRLRDVISSLEVYEDEFTPEYVVPGTIVLLNLLPDLPERQRGMFDFDDRLVVGRVTYRLLRILHDPAAVEGAVREILPELSSLSAKLELISDIGHREGRGHKLVSEEVAAEFEQEWRYEVRATPAEALIGEVELLRVLLLAKREATPSEELLTIPALPELTLAVLRSARSETRSQSMGSRAIRRSPRLAWEVLVDLYGDEATLGERIDDLKAAGLAGDDLLELADRYLGGWRPDDSDDE